MDRSGSKEKRAVVPYPARNGQKQAPGRFLQACLLLGCLGGIPLRGQDTAEPPHWKVEVRLVRVLATVRDGSGRLLTDLTREEFEIYEEGRRQRIALFERSADRSLQIALLLDASWSAAKEREFATAAAVSFLRRVLRPNDQAAIYRFAREVEEVVGYGANWTLLEKAVASVFPSNGTSFYDAVFLAANSIDAP